jgi:sialidase-1
MLTNASMKLFLTFALVSVLMLREAAAVEPPVLLHRRGEHGCHTFRIPALGRTGQGTLIAVYDMRYESSRDLQGHMDIGMSRSTDGGRTWSAPRPIMDMGEFGGLPQSQNGCSDPNILVDRTTNEIMVSALWSHGKPDQHQWRGRGSEPGFAIGVTAQFMIVRSTDDGLTWAAPQNLTRQLKQESWFLFAPAPGNGITLDDGTLVMPTQGRDDEGLPFSNLMSSRDHGKTWTVSAAARHDTTECAVADLGDGTLMLNMRDNRNATDKGPTNGRAVSTTGDLGKTWTVHLSDHVALPEPVCMGSLIAHRLADGKRVLFFSNPRNKIKRQEITVQASLDGGRTWPENHQVLIDPNPSFGYSCLAIIDADTLGILYESSEADIAFRRIPLSELRFK